MKKLFMFLFISGFTQLTSAHSSQILTNYPDFLNAINRGDSIRAIMLINKCSINKSFTNADPNSVIGGMNFTNFNKHQVTVGNQLKNTIATSINMLTEDSKLGAVYNYVRLRIFEDNSAEIFSEYLDPTSYKQLGSVSVSCFISNGHDQNGILLYDVS